MNRSKRNMGRQRLRKSPRPSATAIAKFVEAGKATRWKRGQSGNPKGSSIEFKQFVLRCRESTPEVFEELLAAVRLPRLHRNWRWKLYAATEILSRGWGRSPQVVIDVPTGDKEPPQIPITAQYWTEFVKALRESGALDAKKVEPEDDTTEVLQTDEPKLIELPSSKTHSSRESSESES